MLRLNLRRTSADKKVSWNSNTVDNENMNKKKSKCKSKLIALFLLHLTKRSSSIIFSVGCCIYQKPVPFGESSSEEDDDECDHCFGHVEKKKKNQKKRGDESPSHDSNGSELHACSS